MACSASIAISSRMTTATACSTASPRNATTIRCVDCHGTVDKRPTLVTSGSGGLVDKDGKVKPVDLNNSATAWGTALHLEGAPIFTSNRR